MKLPKLISGYGHAHRVHFMALRMALENSAVSIRIENPFACQWNERFGYLSTVARFSVQFSPHLRICESATLEATVRHLIFQSR